jgi:hypothetical protein
MNLTTNNLSISTVIARCLPTQIFSSSIEYKGKLDLLEVCEHISLG